MDKHAVSMETERDLQRKLHLRIPSSLVGPIAGVEPTSFASTPSYELLGANTFSIIASRKAYSENMPAGGGGVAVTCTVTRAYKSRSNHSSQLTQMTSHPVDIANRMDDFNTFNRLWSATMPAAGAYATER